LVASTAMGGSLLSPLHLILLLLVILLLFGAKRLPEIGRSLGTGMREFKDSVTGDRPEAVAAALPPPAPVPATPPASVPEAAAPPAPAAGSEREAEPVS
jgi:sec-independent protein translocase protein TatA